MYWPETTSMGLIAALPHLGHSGNSIPAAAIETLARNDTQSEQATWPQAEQRSNVTSRLPVWQCGQALISFRFFAPFSVIVRGVNIYSDARHIGGDRAPTQMFGVGKYICRF